MPRDVYSMIANNGKKFFCTSYDEDPPGEDDTEIIEFRPSLKLSKGTMKMLREEAKEMGMTVSDFLSDLVLREVN